MKFALIVFLFYQSGSTVELANSRMAGRYNAQECADNAARETKVLPLQPGNDARWQYATCVQIES